MRSSRYLLVAGAAVAACLLITTAAEASVAVQIDPSALLLARGAAVRLTAEVSCSAPSVDQYLEIDLTQSRGNTVTQGYGDTESFTCDGTSQSVAVDVTPYGSPFHIGPGYAQAYLNVCHATYKGRCISFERAQSSAVVQVSRS